MNLKILAVAALATSGIASAQDKNVPQQLQEIQLPEQVQIPAGKQPQLEGILEAGGTARAAGCIKHQVYNVQGLNRQLVIEMLWYLTFVNVFLF